jgi:signal transduction histidine kinase
VNPRAEEIAVKYEEVLREHLRTPGEATLRSAYEVGREALAREVGILELMAIEQEVFHRLVREAGATEAVLELLEVGEILQTESLTTYEMTHRNAREASATWRLLNERLEGEAKRIAHALHDEAGQLLATAYISLDELAPELPPRARGRLQETRGILDRIGEELRRVSHELRPTILDDLGLVPALEFLAEGVSRRGGFRVRVEGNIEGRLPPAVETALYRVVQEALTNISRHARARNVELVLRREGSEILCTVRDDGIGFDAAKVQSPGNHGRGLGLIGMKERLSAVGGSLVLSSLPGRGSELVFAIPLELSYVGTNTPR